MPTIYEILDTLANTSARNEKIHIIHAEKHNQLLQRTFKFALDPFKVYGIRAVPTPVYQGTESVTLEDFIDYLPNFVDRSITGHAALTKLDELLSHMSVDDASVAARIIKKDLRCGVQGSTVNKVWPEHIFSYPCLLGKSFDPDTIDKHMTWPAIAQLKLDGLRVNALIKTNAYPNQVALFTRSGKPLDIHHMLDQDLLQLHSNERMQDSDEQGVMYDGELLVLDKNGNVLPRKAGNGILNKAIKGTISLEEASRVRIQIWDRVPLNEFYKNKSSEPYQSRFATLLEDAKYSGDPADETMKVLAGQGVKYKIVPHRYVDNLEQANEYYHEALSNGEEGIMLKTVTHLWEDKRSNEMIKFKCEKICELKVVDWLEGTGQFAGYLGKLACESDDGLIEVNVGSGFSREFRIDTKPEDIIGKIISVKFNEVIESVGKPGKFSLFLGRYIETREDKYEADDLETVQATKTVK